MQNTPRANRLHITFLGRTNSGKSTIVNNLAGQEVSIVSSEKGTTTDPVYKAMELLPIGAIMMTYECGTRFLTDYLNGDKYFRIHYEDQNLVRARCHLVYAKDMIARLDEMQAVVAKYCK